MTRGYQDPDTGEKFTETTTVRELAEDHLKNPGTEGVPSQRKLMAELLAAVDGRPAPQVTNERTYPLDAVVAALELDNHGAVYTSPDGCSVQSLYFDRDEVETGATRDDPQQRADRLTQRQGRRAGVRAR